MNYLFLDVDGVLNCQSSKGWDEPAPMGFRLGCVVDDDKVRFFHEIKKSMGEVKVILSSTWRMYEDAKKFLNHKGIFWEDQTHEDKFRFISRDSEIELYLNYHNIDKNRCIILDDSCTPDRWGAALIHTTWKHGLTRELADQAIQRGRILCVT